MEIQHARRFSRREFLAGLTLTGTAGFLGVHPRADAAEPPPETTKLRLVHAVGICRAPQYLAEEFLPGEGLTEVHYVKEIGSVRTRQALASGEADLSMTYIGPLLIQADARQQTILLAGVQIGCFELIGTERVRAIRDLKGKTVAVSDWGGSDHIFLAIMAAYVGLDPKEITWVVHPQGEAVRLLAEDKIDAFMAFPPIGQELRAQRIGRVVVNSMMDRPWSQYFCCLVAGNRDFVQKHPVATKRALRAILKGAAVCAREPERVAQFLVAKGYAQYYDHALQAVKEIPYDKWHEYDPEDTVRFYALRLHEVGMVTSTPQSLIAQGTDWRFLNELKQELKG
jgi:NitT/TauT family transport system substrate-binding protein